MPGSPPTSPVHGAPRYADSDAASFSAQVNGITDRFDITAMRLDTGLASARPGTGPGTGAWYYATDTRTLSRWNGSAWETNLPNAHAATHQDGGTDALTVREAMMATGALGPSKGYFSAYRNAALSLATGGVVVFDTEEDDLSNWYDPATGRFNPQIPSEFSFSWAVTFNVAITADNYLQSQMRKNGTVHRLGQIAYQRGSVPLTSVGSARVKFNGTTDYVDIIIATNQAATALATGAAATYFNGNLVGRS